MTIETVVENAWLKLIARGTMTLALPAAIGIVTWLYHIDDRLDSTDVKVALLEAASSDHKNILTIGRDARITFQAETVQRLTALETNAANIADSIKRIEQGIDWLIKERRAQLRESKFTTAVEPLNAPPLIGPAKLAPAKEYRQ